jgi:hypothetical protein
VSEEKQLNHSEHPEYGDGSCTDTRGRLYVRTTAAGSTVWYCHDCGRGSRTFRENKRTPSETVAYFKQLQAGKTLIQTRVIHLPPDMTSELPIPALVWLHKYGITKEEIEIFRFGWSPSYKRLILPVWHEDKLLYWQGRTFSQVTKENPKYLNIRQSGVKNVYFENFTGNRILCIVEDILSAIKVGRFCDSLALLGSYLPADLSRIMESYDRVYLWLDEDKWKTSIHAMQKFTQLIGKPIMPIKTVLDPKELSDQVIQQLLKGE